MKSNEYWEQRFREEGKIWGESSSKSAYDALKFFLAHNVKTVLVPGMEGMRNYSPHRALM
jgi:hypothetical protein